MPDQITGDNPLLADAMREALSDKWTKLRGISIVSIAMAPPVVSDKDLQLIQDAQRAAFNSNANMAAGTLVSAQADAMRAAANNANGEKVYRIQLFALSKSKPIESFGIPNLKVREVNGMYKYYIGDYSSNAEANRILETMMDKFPEAIVLESR